jgi:lipopolysaccharide transport system permease protein
MNPHRIIIEPDSVARNYWKDVWKFRELFYFLAWRDLLVRYKQTAIGILWSVLRPLLTLCVMVFIGWLFESEVPSGIPRVLLVASATLPWTLFSTAFSESANSLITNSNLLTKVYFPRMIVPASTILVCLVDFFISFLLFLILMLIYQYQPGWQIVMLPIFLILALIASFGAGVYISALNVKYRDFRYIVPFVVQFGLYVSPLAFSSSDIYSSSRIPEFFKWIYSLNPMVSVIDGFRWCLLGGTPIYWPGFLLSFLMSTLLLIIGVRYFRKTERSFADII